MKSDSRIFELRQIRSQRSKESAAGRYARSHMAGKQAFPTRSSGSYTPRESSSFGMFAKRRWKVALLTLCMILFLEIFIFNMPFWSSRTTKTRTVTLSSSNFTNVTPVTGGFTVTGPNPSVTIDNPANQKIKYIHIDQSSSAPSWATYDFTVFTFFGNGQTPNSNYDKGNLSTGLYRSRYVNVGGTCHKVRILFDMPVGRFLPFVSITVNPHVSFHFSLVRFAFMILLGLFAVFLGPNSPLWRWKMQDGGAFQIWTLCVSTVFIMLFYAMIFYTSESWSAWTGSSMAGVGWSQWANFNQYGDLANSLLHGHTWLDLPVPPPLKAMQNPYDPYLRQQLIFQNGGPQKVKIYWDHAFYHGKYYCYFGVIPAIVFFMPFEIMTGKEMESCWAILMAVLIAAIFATLLLVRMSKIWFPNVSFGAVLLASWMLGMGGGILYHVFTASFYSVPESCSYMFSMIGLWCWFESIRQRKDGRRRRVSAWWIFFGSLFMACNLGCRPQYIFLCLLGLPIFWTAIFKERMLFSKSSIFATVMAFVPFFLVFIPLFIYNFVRFGSFFTFGNTYQLTNFDATDPGFTYLSAAKGIFYYLFQPMNLTTSFPFVGLTNTSTLLFYPMEPSEGGYFTFVAPFAVILFAAPWIFSRSRRGELTEEMSGSIFEGASVRRSVTSFVWTAIASGICVMCADSYLGGVSQRYISDFGVLFILGAVCCFFAVLPRTGQRIGPAGKLLILASVIAVCICLTIEFFGIFTIGRYGSLLSSFPCHYFPVKDWFLFLS